MEQSYHDILCNCLDHIDEFKYFLIMCGSAYDIC